MKNGFSLVEVIVSITIISIVGVTLTTILNRTFQANDKSQLIGVIRQNGSLALNIMQEVIRTSEKVVCTKSDNTVLVVQKRTGSLVRFSIKSDVSADNPAIIEDFPVIPPTNPNTFADLCTTVTPTSDATYITNKDATYGVQAENLIFTLISGSDTNNGVKVSFTLKQAKNAPDNFSNQVGGGFETFQTTVYIR